jgi:dTDP-4-amino-4,6-dideoxygalactose transaminase
LHLSVLALDLKEGDKVITTPITFAASANCIRFCGGEVVFSDIDAETYLIDVDKVRQLLERSPAGTYKGIIPVDFAGRAVDLEKLRGVADEFGLWIIEDACHAPGGFFYDGNGTEQRCGNGKFADLSVFSFHPVKHIAAGEGGMVTTNNRELYKKLLMLRTHGITRDQHLFTNPVNFAAGREVNAEDYPGWYMEMKLLGYNYRLTDFQAALASSQLKRANEGLSKRRDIAATYNNAFKNSPAVKKQTGLVEGHAYHLYIIEVEDRFGFYMYLKENRILAQIHYIPCHLMPYYKALGWKYGDMPNAENYYKRCISLPMFPALTENEQALVIQKTLEWI